MYSSTLADFRKQRAQGKLGPPATQNVRVSSRRDAQSHEVAKLERENRRLRRDLSRATLVIDVQKKVSELLGITLTDMTEDRDSQ
jgi:hypothetical protein